jgi:hypothetical protein
MILQTTADLKEIVATNDATVTGILISITIAFGVTIVYLYKNVQTLNKEHMNELRAFNETLLKVNNSYNEFVKNMIELKSK